VFMKKLVGMNNFLDVGVWTAATPSYASQILNVSWLLALAGLRPAAAIAGCGMWGDAQLTNGQDGRA
jgi:hypothetical protein